jgi:murein DD-endopeptidase MepM/ murein hydrolase activator NlpD
VGPSEDELKSSLKQIDAQIATLQAAVRAKGRLYHGFLNEASSPQFMWEDAPEAAQLRRRHVAALVRVELRELVHELDVFSQRREDLSYELEWMKLRAQSAPKIKIQAQHAARPFYCAQSPVAPLSGEKINLAQDFGVHRDKDSGVEWQSSGWWLTQIDAKVRVCAAGTIAFVGKVAGRGRVILIDHGAGNMTLYANLNDDPGSKWAKGMKVSPGAELGTSRERLYFEVRQAGQAIDPRRALSRAGLESFAL